MTIKEILLEANQKVSYPWSPEKIERAGINPIIFLKEVGEKIKQADDYDPKRKSVKQFLKAIKGL